MIQEPFLNRLWEKINKGKKTDCWEWTASLTAGYGRIGFMGKNLLAHRLIYQMYRGDVPKELVVCHKCDNRKCCNPEHLFLGTHLDNNRDMDLKKRRKTVYGEQSGMARLTEKQVKEIRAMKGKYHREFIAKTFSTTVFNVTAIHTRKTWKHI